MSNTIAPASRGLGVIKCLLSIPTAIKPSCCALETPRRSSGWYAQGSHSSIRKTHKSAVMRELAVPEETRKHRQRVIGKGLIDERLLPLKRLYGTAGGEVVRAVKKRCDNLGKQFRNSGKPARRFAIAVVFGLPEHKLPAIRCVADIQPIDTFFKKR
jgi:hypothetical protein